MSTEKLFEQLLVDISKEIELRLEEDRGAGFNSVLVSYFENSSDQKMLLSLSDEQKEALLRLTHALLVIGEYGQEMQAQLPDQNIDEMIDELYEYCHVSLIAPQEAILEPVAEFVETLFAE